MTRMLQDSQDYVKATEPLLKLNHAFTSERMLAKRFFGATGEDRFPRTLDRLEDTVNGQLIVMRGRKLELTPLGLALREVLQKLLALRNREPESDPVEELTVAVAASIPPDLIGHLTVRFCREWAGLVHLRFVAFDPETVREQVASGTIAFAIALNEEVSGAEPLAGVPLVWSILALRDHSLANLHRPLIASDLADHRIALPPGVSARVVDGLGRAHPANQIQTPSREAAHEIAASGAAVALDLNFANRPEFEGNRFSRRHIEGLEPERIVLCLPRHPNDLSDPAKFLVEQVRTAARDAALLPIPAQEIPSAEFDPLPDLSMIPEPLPS